MTATQQIHLDLIGRGRASDTATFRAPAFRTGEDAARVSVYEAVDDKDNVFGQVCFVGERGDDLRKAFALFLETQR